MPHIKVKAHILTHGGAWAISGVVGLIYVSHHFFIPMHLAGKELVYEPVTPRSYYDEATFYAHRANAVYNGQWRAGDVNLYEYKEGPVILSLINPVILGGLGRIAGSLKNGFILSDFLFPALIFFLVYGVAYEMTSRRLASLLVSAVFLFVPKFGISLPPVSLLHVRELAGVLFPFMHTDNVLYFSQFEYPKITFVFFALSFLLCFCALKKYSWTRNTLAGISFGLLFYTYFFDWASFLVGLVLMAAWYGLWMKDTQRVKTIGVILGIGFLTSSIYWLNMWYVQALPQAQELMLRVGREVSHSFRFASVAKSYLRNGVLSLMLFILARRSLRVPQEGSEIYIIPFLLAYFVVVNAQVLVGFNVQPDHWYRIQFLFVALAVWLLLMRWYDAYRPDRQRKYGPYCAFAFLIYFLAVQFYGQYVYSAANAENYTLPRGPEKSYQWLGSHTPKGSVVGALSLEANRDILLYTHNKIFLPNGLNSLASDEEIWERFFILNDIFNVDAKGVEAGLRDPATAYYLFSEAYGDHSFDAMMRGGYERKFPETLVREKVNAYRQRFKGVLDLPPLPYRLDYLYVDNLKIPPLDELPQLRFHLEKVYHENAIRIYRVGSNT